MNMASRAGVAANARPDALLLQRSDVGAGECHVKPRATELLWRSSLSSDPLRTRTPQATIGLPYGTYPRRGPRNTRGCPASPCLHRYSRRSSRHRFSPITKIGRFCPALWREALKSAWLLGAG